MDSATLTPINYSSNVTFVKKRIDFGTLLVLFAFCEKNIIRYAALAFSFVPIIGQLYTIIVPLVYVLLFICYFFNKSNSIKFNNLYFLLFVILSIISTVFLYPQNAKYIFKPTHFWNTIFPCFYWFLIGLIFLPNEKIFDAISKLS